jgi:hypothetical protein
VSNIVGVRVPPSAPAKLCNAATARKQIVNDVATLRHAGEMKSYIDLLLLTLIVVLCISKIVTN